MITVISYMKVIPPGNKNPAKPMIIRNFIEGVNRCGDKGLVTSSRNIIEADVAVIQGFVHKSSKNTPHLILRKNIFENQIRKGKRCIIVDSSLFLWKDPAQLKGYLRYGYDGIFPGTAEYCNVHPDPERWKKISQDLDIELKPWKLNQKEGHILLCCQRDGGWSMDGKGVQDWLKEVITQIRMYSKRSILIRFHPGDKNTTTHRHVLAQWMKSDPSTFSDIFISKTKSLQEDFHTAHSLVGHNSSPTCASVIEGIPTFLTDASRAQASTVAHHQLSEIEDHKSFDRQLFVERLAQMHWTLEEVKSGQCWLHMRKWATKSASSTSQPA